MGLIAGVVGEKAAKWVAIGLGVLIAVIILIVVVRCQPVDHTAERQAEQTTKSGDAFSNAVQNGVATIDNRTVTEHDIDAATANVQKEIGNAANPDDVRTVILSSVCSEATHRNDPSCRVQ